MTFEPLDNVIPDSLDALASPGAGPQGGATDTAPLPRVANPWGANLDQTASPTPAQRLALGTNLTTTPEYKAANLPAYKQRSLLSYFLLQ